MRAHEFSDTQGLKGPYAPSPLRLIIADDHALFRQGLRSLLVREGLEIVAEAGHVGGLRATLAANPCDVLLLDLQMDQWSMDLISKLSRKTAVIVLTETDNVEIGRTAMRLGARALVHKRFSFETLITTIRAVAEGRKWMPPPAMQGVPIARDGRATKQLTRRESEIVREVALGLRSAEVAERLSVSEGTVKSHLSKVFQKLGIRDRTELIRYAIKTGLVT